MARLIRDIVDACFDGVLPERTLALVDWPLSQRLIEDYKLNPVLCFGADRAPRIAYSGQGEADQWARQVASLWPHDGLAGHLRRADSEGRRMVDSDGSERAVVYLDDLQLVAHEIDERYPVLCACLHLPEGDTTVMTRHTAPPLDLLPAAFRQRVQGLLDLGATGLWGVRKRASQVVGVLWVTESRWRDNTAESLAIVERFQPPGLWFRLKSIARDHGAQIYPDGVELRPDGSLDVTVGVLMGAKA